MGVGVGVGGIGGGVGVCGGVWVAGGVGVGCGVCIGFGVDVYGPGVGLGVGGAESGVVYVAMTNVTLYAVLPLYATATDPAPALAKAA